MNVQLRAAAAPPVDAHLRVDITVDDQFEIRSAGITPNVHLIDIFRLGGDGLLHEHWGVLDALAMMQQLGVVPAGPPA